MLYVQDNYLPNILKRNLRNRKVNGVLIFYTEIQFFKINILVILILHLIQFKQFSAECKKAKL